MDYKQVLALLKEDLGKSATVNDLEGKKITGCAVLRVGAHAYPYMRIDKNLLYCSFKGLKELAS